MGSIETWKQCAEKHEAADKKHSAALLEKAHIALTVLCLPDEKDSKA